MLSDINLDEEYFSDSANLVEAFYRPCLLEAQEYDRSVGYFRSSVFIIILPEIIEFAKRGGKLRLVCSPNLSDKDIELMNEGYEDKNRPAEQALYRDIELLSENESTASNFEVLATLVSLDILNIKIAYMPGFQGVFHDKLGIFTDWSNNVVSFKGSANETWSGWHERGNHETLDVSCSWREGRDIRNVVRAKDQFEKLWGDQCRSVKVVPFPDLGIQMLKKLAKNTLDDINPSAIVDYYSFERKYTAPMHGRQVRTIDNRKPFKHQTDAIEKWYKQGKRGILQHATGSGKTFTALIAIKDHLQLHGIAIVLVPDRLLHSQWTDELNQSIHGLNLLKAGAGHNDWRKNGLLYQFTSPLKPKLAVENRVVLATMQTARTDNFLSLVNSGDHIFLIADEVHEIGSENNSRALTIDSGPRLGLSATPNRYGDPEGTTRILEYFGPVIDPPYTLKNAIDDQRLVPYDYFPMQVQLNQEESEQWAKRTEEISQEMARSKRDENENIIMSKKLLLMIFQRARIAKKAEEKISLAVRVVKSHFQENQSWLIYCEDQEQLTAVKKELQKVVDNPLEYHTNMVGSRSQTIKYFERFGGVLCSIRCLDQGVDIPNISHALILASSQNPRQFIQRRGRVLRTSDKKYKAVIFDAIVTPVSLEEEPSQLSLLKSELQRSIQFAENALNSNAGIKLKLLAIELGIDPYADEIMDTDGIEEDTKNEA